MVIAARAVHSTTEPSGTYTLIDWPTVSHLHSIHITSPPTSFHENTASTCGPVLVERLKAPRERISASFCSKVLVTVGMGGGNRRDMSNKVA
jgi:hypothetical protein